MPGRQHLAEMYTSGAPLSAEEVAALCSRLTDPDSRETVLERMRSDPGLNAWRDAEQKRIRAASAKRAKEIRRDRRDRRARDRWWAHDAAAWLDAWRREWGDPGTDHDAAMDAWRRETTAHETDRSEAGAWSVFLEAGARIRT
jgi:hypothetical protein